LLFADGEGDFGFGGGDIIEFIVGLLGSGGGEAVGFGKGVLLFGSGPVEGVDEDLFCREQFVCVHYKFYSSYVRCNSFDK
jgi:hypothetical protein